MSDPRIEIFQGDITALELDAIVNAANEELAQGSGVCGAIFRGAGAAEMNRACDAVAPCPTGEARITPGFKLPARHVIHTVGPIWAGGTQDEPDLLAGCYRNSLNLARETGVTSIAFPAISTGVYGFPLEQATDIAVATVEDWIRHDKTMKRVVFAVFGSEAEAAYRRRLEG